MSAKPKLGPRSTPTDFHPCPGSAPQGAWMNILMDDSFTKDYGLDVAVTLKQWEVHNLIVTMYHAAQEVKKNNPESHSAQVYMATATKLERHWQRSLRRSWTDRR